MEYWTKQLQSHDGLLYGRVTYQMMEATWRRPSTGGWPGWMESGEHPFAEAIDGATKYVVSNTLDEVDWNAELLHGDLGEAVRQLKQQDGAGLLVGGVALPTALADLGLIDEYEFVVHPVVAGHGPTLLGGLSKRVRLAPVDRTEFASGVVVQRYRPAEPTAGPAIGEQGSRWAR